MLRSILKGGKPFAERQFRGGGGSALLVHIKPGVEARLRAVLEEQGLVELEVPRASNPWQVNQAVVELLSRVLEVPRDALEIVAGLHKSGKVVTIRGLAPGEVQRRLRAAAAMG